MTEALDVAVIGCGIAGLSAARECLRRGLRTATLESLLPGGLVLNISHLDGEVEGSGMDLAMELMAEVTDLGGEAMTGTASAIASTDKGLLVTTDAGDILAAAVIVASGATLRRLGIPGEAELDGQGVSQCAECDGPLFRGQEVVVVGGGDSALQEALILSQYVRHVHLLHRGDSFTARQAYIDALASKDNVTVRWRTLAEGVRGDSGVSAVITKDLATGAISEIACSGFFAFVGLEPNASFVPEKVQRDAHGYLITDNGRRTTARGLYAVGAVRAGSGGQLRDALSDARLAAASIVADRPTRT